MSANTSDALDRFIAEANRQHDAGEAPWISPEDFDALKAQSAELASLRERLARWENNFGVEDADAAFNSAAEIQHIADTLRGRLLAADQHWHEALLRWDLQNDDDVVEGVIEMHALVITAERAKEGETQK